MRGKLVWNAKWYCRFDEDDDDVDDWYEDTEKIWEKRRKAQNKFDKKIEKIWGGERSYESYGDVSYDATTEVKGGDSGKTEAYSEGYYDDYHSEDAVENAPVDEDATMYDYYNDNDAPIEEAMDAAAEAMDAAEEDYDDWDYK